MLMKLITLDFNKHRFDLVELYVKYFTWIVEEVKKIYDIDLWAGITMTIREFFENSINTYESYKPPDGIIYLIQVNESIMGTGSLLKYDENIGELKKLFIQPECRGNNYGKVIVRKLLEKGKEFGFKKIYLETAQYMEGAIHIYRSLGFTERAEYQKSETPPSIKKYAIYMEKKYD